VARGSVSSHHLATAAAQASSDPLESRVSPSVRFDPRRGMESEVKSEAKRDEHGSGAAGSCKVYHERQRLQFCLLHALNNLMQVSPLFLISHYISMGSCLLVLCFEFTMIFTLSTLFNPNIFHVIFIL
jgi:hypothetical protein